MNGPLCALCRAAVLCVYRVEHAANIVLSNINLFTTVPGHRSGSSDHGDRREKNKLSSFFQRLSFHSSHVSSGDGSSVESRSRTIDGHEAGLHGRLPASIINDNDSPMSVEG